MTNATSGSIRRQPYGPRRPGRRWVAFRTTTLALATMSATLIGSPAQSIASTTEPIVIGERITLESKVMQETRTLLISTPRGYATSDTHYPVLVLTDGDAHLVHTRGTVDFLADNNGLMPNLIIVGITNTDRTRDLTPTRAGVAAADGTVRELPTSGGGERFLQFITTEVLPWVDGHYRTQPYRILAGHSFGGLLALYSVLEHPEAFQAVIAASPSLDWDDDLIFKKATAFYDRPAARKKLRNKALFVTMANEEAGDPRPNRFDRLTALIASQQIEGFVFGSRHMPDETHGSVVLRSHDLGLRTIFDTWRPPRDAATGAIAGDLDAIQKHYARLSRRFGFPIAAPEAVINLAGYQALGDGDLAGALDLFRYNVATYPESANVHDSLGEALERAGRNVQALAHYSRAVEIGRKADDPNLSIFLDNMRRAASAVEAERR